MNFNQMNINQLRSNPNMLTSMLSAIGINFPVTRDELIQEVQASGVNKQVVDQLNRLPNKTYNDASDIVEALASLR